MNIRVQKIGAGRRADHIINSGVAGNGVNKGIDVVTDAPRDSRSRYSGSEANGVFQVLI